MSFIRDRARPDRKISLSDATDEGTLIKYGILSLHLCFSLCQRGNSTAKNKNSSYYFEREII